MRLCLAIPENTDPSHINIAIRSIKKCDMFSHYDVQVLEMPHERSAIFDTDKTKAFVEETSHYRTFAFLTFPDGSIHFAHGEAISDRWRHHDSRVYQVNLEGEVIAREPLQLFSHVLTRSQTSDHVWDPSQHYMRSFLH
ncbi:MAG: hypothetical protein KBC35_00930 [Candidatus Pacebacteria bacterium]|nr:hypothetical protein [Candidatus Paceibacterota bacterium]